MATRQGFPQFEFSTENVVTVDKVSQKAGRSDRYEVRIVDNSGRSLRLILTDQAVGDLRLKPGAEALAGPLLEAAAKTRAEDLLVAALARRAHSRRELEQLLRRRGAPQEAARHALARADSLGLLDDAAFASGVVRARIAGRSASVAALRRELSQKGVARDLADAAIAGGFADTDLDEAQVAADAARRRARALRSHEPAVVRRRVIAFLRRRGFGADAIRRAVQQLDRRDAD